MHRHRLAEEARSAQDVRRRAPTEELVRLVDAIVDPDARYAALHTNGRYRALVFMGNWLGPRWNEAIGLRVCDINPLRKELTFGRVVVNQNGNTIFIEKMSKTEDARTHCRSPDQ